jgi:predicted CoA-binding protein
MAKFQMVGSDNPNTIADVTAEVDIDSFRKDSNWYEVVEEVVQKPAKAAKQPKVTKEEE